MEIDGIASLEHGETSQESQGLDEKKQVREREHEENSDSVDISPDARTAASSEEEEGIVHLDQGAESEAPVAEEQTAESDETSEIKAEQDTIG